MHLIKRHNWATGIAFVVAVALLPGTASAMPTMLRWHPVAVIATASETPSSLETAASRASNLGRTVAFSLIGLALAVSAVVLVFRRDFKEAIGLLVIGVIAVLLASPVGVSVLQDTVSTLFGAG
jgi:DMSO reductase anchor subunit